MPNHGHYGATSDIRWVHDGPGPTDGHFERRCPDCVQKRKGAWWELSIDFWNPRTMVRCRECESERRSRLERQRLQSLSFRERRNAQQRAYWRRNRRLMIEKQRLRRAAAQSSSGAPA